MAGNDKYYTSDYAADAPSDRLTRRLPFAIEETDKVNALYLENCDLDDPSISEIVDIWTYCYVRKYFQLKYAKDFDGSVSDYEKLMADTFRKISAGIQGLGSSSRYASWVSVICKNTYLNFLRGKKKYLSVDRLHVPLEAKEPGIAEKMDARLQFSALQQAIDRLPAFLRTVAVLRIIEEKDYETIAEETGKEVPTIRSYVNKAVTRLRNDRVFMRYFDRM